MVDAPGTTSESRRGETESEGEHWGEGRATVVAWNLPIVSEEARTGVGHGGAQTPHERHVPDARCPLRHSTEHAACVKLPDLETVFGPAMGQTRLWALNENCCPHMALQISLRYFSH
jgi:hypothetical protein